MMMASVSRRHPSNAVGESSRAQQFLDLEAAVDSEEDEEEVDPEELEHFLVDDEADDQVQCMDFTRLYSAGDVVARETEEQEARAVLDRWKASRAPAYKAAFLNGSENLMGLVGDRIYWMVHVRRNKEEGTAKALNKELPHGFHALKINGLPARIYVSAPSEVEHADRIIKRSGAGFPHAYVRRGVLRVSEMDKQLLERQMDKTSDMSLMLPVGSWVTIRDGLYAGDVGMVYRSVSSSDEIQILVAPRLPLGPEEYYRKSRNGQVRNRPPPTLCILDNVPDGEMESGPVNGSFRVGDEVFLVNGLKLITVQGLHYARRTGRPTASDVWMFTLAGCDTVLETNRSFLRVGDGVQVTRGMSSGAFGIVNRVENESVELDVGEERPMLANLPDVTRVFSMGCTVAVRLGQHKGVVGLVCGVEETEIDILVGEGRTMIRVRDAAVETVTEPIQLRNVPTERSMSLHAAQKKNPALNKIVYVIPLRRIGRVRGINTYEDRTTYLVEHGGKMNSEFIEFRPSELVFTDTWLKADGASFDNVDEAKKLFGTFVLRGFNPVWKLVKEGTLKPGTATSKPRYIDILDTSNHVVFVSAKRFKRFGFLTGSNGNGNALVAWDKGPGQALEVLNAAKVISMKTGRRLSGEPAGNMYALRRRCRDLYGTDFRYRLTLAGPKQGVGKKKSTERPVNEELASAPILPPIDLGRMINPAHPCFFLLRDDFVDVYEQYSVLFVFMVGCTNPKSVDGKTAWTTFPRYPETRLQRDVMLTYKTQDLRTKSEFVPVSSLELCRPRIQKGELALVVKGPDAGKVVYPARYDKVQGLGRKGVYCKMREGAKKSEEILYSSDSLTRVLRKKDGPPAL